MSRVLYEAHFHFEFFMLIPIIMLVFIIFFPKLIEISYEQKGMEVSEAGKNIVRISCVIAGITIAVFSLLIFLGHRHMYEKTVVAYKNGEYEIVEGYVENFVPMPYSGHAMESFEIDGVHFEYSDYNLIQGYHNTRSHGGVIYGDGQYLKVGYVKYNETYGNIIVYIEQIYNK